MSPIAKYPDFTTRVVNAGTFFCIYFIMPAFRKPKVLKKKNIKRRTGARNQAKQISALSTQMSKLTSSQYESTMLVWERLNASIDSTLGGTNAYVCPIPTSPCNPFKDETLQLPTGERITWSDTKTVSTQLSFAKTPVFGWSEAARNSPEVHHTGSTLKYRLQVNGEETFSTYSLFLIKAKARQADQLITDRNLKAATTLGSPGAGALLIEGVDYVTHEDLMGTMMNKKYWNVLYSREINFSHPGATAIATNTNPANTNPLNNALIATGTLRIPAGGVIRNFNAQAPITAGNPDEGNKPTNACQIGYVDENNKSPCYLVIINNGAAADAETIDLSLLVKDYYKCVV